MNSSLADGAEDGLGSDLIHRLLGKTSAMLAYWDASLCCRFANRAFEQWFGVAPDALVGTDLSSFLGSSFQRDLPYIEAALRGEPQDLAREVADPYGGPARHSLMRLVPDIVTGVVRGFFVLVADASHDISEAREAAETASARLRESEERFRLTLDEAPIGMALVSPEGRFFRVNRALCEIVGYSQEELIGLTFQAITHPDDLSADLALVEKLARGEIPRYQREKRYIRKDGTVVDIMLNGSVLRGSDGAPIHFIAQIEDITQRKRQEKENAFLAEASSVLASSLDFEQTVTTISQLVVRDFADWCAIEIEEKEGDLTRLKVVSADPSKAQLATRFEQLALDRQRPYLLRPVVETRQPLLIPRVTSQHIEAAAQGAEHLRALRSINPESVMALPLIMRGRLMGVLAIVSSSPARRYDQRDLRLAEALANRASTAIENALLYRASEEATQMRDEVLSVVAHDLRNPLGALVLQVNALRRRRGQPERRSTKPLEAIEHAARRMSRLIRDLLDVSRMQAGHFPLEQARVSAAQVMADFIASQRELAASGSLELSLDQRPDLPEVWADRDRLLQVFENLVSNAMKFTPAGGHITLGAAPQPGEVLFWVADDGAGISPQALPRLFDRFWQARRNDRRGAGLGLPIVKGIVETHGGRIWVKSQIGRGSTFYFTLPIATPR
jgi:PAS domain S-box-containing protein